MRGGDVEVVHAIAVVIDIVARLGTGWRDSQFEKPARLRSVIDRAKPNFIKAVTNLPSVNERCAMKEVEQHISVTEARVIPKGNVAGGKLTYLLLLLLLLLFVGSRFGGIKHGGLNHFLTDSFKGFLDFEEKFVQSLLHHVGDGS